MVTRPLTTQNEFAQAVHLQREIWGFDDVELLPLRLFVVASKIGGQVLGAFDGKKMVGFCLSVPGMKPGGTAYLHGHMMGVLPEYRNSGLGRRMKLHQRQFALSQGIDLIEWTFDPLEIKNAFFNIERLGAIIRRHVRNQYGTSTSHLHGGLPTDRLIAEWWIRSPRVLAICDGAGAHQSVLPLARIAIPADIGYIKAHDRDYARRIQEDAARQFETLFNAGLAVIGFDRSESHGTYLLGKWDSP